MKGPTLSDFKQRFPHASAAVIERNSHLFGEGAGAGSKLECVAGDVALGPAQTEKRAPRRFRVCVCRIGRHLLDEDNIAEKYMVDCLRYAGIIPDDNPGVVSIVATQRKAAKGEPEHTQIEVYELT